ncbi:MAG TPA: hypothetical protein VFT22_45520 [Kofleriaceae bacterium]|nr:hypothetical protein [Kofleriaceae bacterium]
MFKLVVGILKGAVIGAAVGYGAYALTTATGFGNPWLTYGAIGALVGLIAGRSLWSLIRDKNATTWVAILKGAFGFGIGCGLYAMIAKVWNPSTQILLAGENIFTWPVTLGGAIGAVYGGFVELDDAIGDDKKPAAKQPPTKQPPAKQGPTRATSNKPDPSAKG